jgi:drug/metabolite transporter (DMT)-like permease
VTNRRPLVALIAGALAIAFSPIFVRISPLEPTATAFYRMALALPLFALWGAVERRSAPSATDLGATLGRRRRVLLLLASGMFFAFDLVCWHWSIRYTSVTNATFLANLAPIIVTVAAWLIFRERVTASFLAGMALSLVGAALLVRASLSFGGSHPLGDALGVLAAFFYAGYLLTAKGLRRTMGTARLMGWSTLVTSVVLLAVTVAAGESLFTSSWRGWLVLLGLAWMSQVLGQGLIVYGLAHLPASFSSVGLLIQPVAAALLAWMLLGEALGAWQLAGGVAVLVGILVARRATL